MTKLRCKKEYGVFQYEKIVPSCYNDLDGTIYELYDENGNYINSFGSYGDMKYYVETGIIL
jgi:hypothetical protein